MKRLDYSFRPVNITGHFMAVFLDDGQPVCVSIEGVRFLPVFSTAEKCREVTERACLALPWKIQIITDGRDFLSSVLPQVRVILDPWVTDHKTTRFTEILSDPSQNN